MEVVKDMGTDEEDTGTGGRQTTGIGDILQGSGAVGYYIRVWDLGADLSHGKVSGKFPAQVHQVDYREAAKATGGWELVVLTAGDRDVRSECRGGGRIFPQEAE